MTAHFVLLMGNDAQIGPGMGAAQEHETRGFVLGIIAAGFGLIDFASEQAAGAGRAPSLQAHVGQIQAGFDAGIQHVIDLGNRQLDFSAVSDKSDLMNGHGLSPKNSKSEARNPKQLPNPNSSLRCSAFSAVASRQTNRRERKGTQSFSDFVLRIFA
jgi:hypothetical protein